MAKNSLTVITGGLGNQLFQIARGLFVSKDGSLLVDRSLGIPRLNQEGRPEVSSYFDDSIYVDSEASRNVLGSRIFNFALRFGITSNKSKIQKRTIPLVEMLCSVAFLFLQGKPYRFNISSGIGYDPRNNGRTSVQVGYFQTFRWLEQSHVLDTLKNLKVREVGKDLRTLQEIAVNAKPLIVHCRFGDYKSESDFGIPDENYYQRALDLMFSTCDYPEIWVFSDEIDLAKEKIPQNYLGRVRWIEDVDNSSAASLDAMRLGSGYIIANSTFSWWGAMLTVNTGAPVIAPKKWFKNAEDPVDLIPDSWTRIDPW
jgi:hypothetical protein